MAAHKGHKKAGGRPKGGLNKTTLAVKAALVAAFEEMGGIPSLVAWGKKNRTEFYKLWGRLIPTEIKNVDGERFQITLGADVRRRLEEVDGDGPGQPGETGGDGSAELADAAPPAGG